MTANEDWFIPGEVQCGRACMQVIVTAWIDATIHYKFETLTFENPFKKKTEWRYLGLQSQQLRKLRQETEDSLKSMDLRSD